MRNLLLLLPLIALLGCASGGGANEDFNAFLRQVAAECKPLIIGNDNFGQAITSTGQGADPDDYSKFISYTSLLYRGGISAAAYRESMTAFLGPGTYNRRSLDCIVAHLPEAKSGAQPPPAK